MSQVVLRGGRGSSRFEVTLGPGAHAVVGAAGPRAAQLVAALSGLARPGWLEVRVDGRSPFGDPELRRRTGSLLESEEPAEAATVGAAIYPLLRLRGGAPSPTDALSAFGLAGWAERRPASLSAVERRSVALAVALALPDPLVLALHEPLLAGLDRGQVLASLMRHAARGAVVLAVLSSEAEAAELGAEQWGLSRETLFRAATARVGMRARFSVATEDVRALGRALSTEPDVTLVTWDDTGPSGQVKVEGVDEALVALAVLRAARAESIRVTAITRVGAVGEGGRGPS